MLPESKPADAVHARPPEAGEGWVTARAPQLAEAMRRLVSFPGLVYGHRDLVAISVRRDLEARFSGTVLGWAWPLVHPMFLFVVYYFIFTKLLSFKIEHLPPGQESALGVYMFCGIMAWASIAESLTRGTGSIVDNGNLIKKLAFPSEILPLNVALVGLVTMSFAVVVFVAGSVLTPIWRIPGPAVLWVPL